MKQLTGEQKQKRRRIQRISFWSIIIVLIVAAECLIVGALVSMGKTPGIVELLMYQMIIPIVCGFAVFIGLVARKLKPDLYDEYAVTSLVTIEAQARKFVELHNQFAKERSDPATLEITKKKGGV